MRKIIFILFFFTTVNSTSQTQNRSSEVLEDIIDRLSNTKGEIKIYSRIDSIQVEAHLKAFIENEQKIYFLKTKYSKDSIILTTNEKRYLLEEIRKQYRREWQQKDFTNNTIISGKSGKAFTNESRRNAIVSISNPIFIRNDEIAFLYYSYSCCGNSGYGHNKLSFYRKSENAWKEWIWISAFYY